MRRRRGGRALAALLPAAALAAAVLFATVPLAAGAQGEAPQAPPPQAPAQAPAQAPSSQGTPPRPTAPQAGTPMYVIEQLTVSVYSAPGADADRVATLKSGDRVEVIERAGDAVHVRLPGGRDGWVRASYLTAAEPLRAQLAARSAEVAHLQADVARLEGELRAAQAPPARVAPTIERGQVRGPLLDAAPVVYRPRWRWVALSALLSLAIGFGLGWWVLDRRIRAKYGGLRIY